ncbi:uncharacterized protein N7483_007575 [Penicillium malachiteum]|uniref:uncharacterized protein n=1 Tax=Penicillium malachiteum TaxID=1324776 RepID=UPI002546D713|nr:uncharacterized protein N7483_007575 [Penicillium malachiteum]KAJ5726218.1 hypothetical protein N7483_007575 [Penicillium malachiteum]
MGWWQRIPLLANVDVLSLDDNQGDILETFKFRQSVARPDFLDMYMTVEGTLLFSECEPKVIIDDRTLETGLCLWVQYQNNGRRERAWRAQMFMMEFPDNFRAVHPNMEPLDGVLIYMEPEELGDEDPDPEVILEDEPSVIPLLVLVVGGGPIKMIGLICNVRSWKSTRATDEMM